MTSFNRVRRSSDYDKASSNFPLNSSSSQQAPLQESTISIKRTPSPDRRSSPMSRRRPRGSEGGKSIHKAAEASVPSLISLPMSSDLTSQQRRNSGLSLGPPTRMAPAPPKKDDLNKWKSDEDSPSDSDSGHCSSASVAASLSESSHPQDFKLSRSCSSRHTTSQVTSKDGSASLNSQRTGKTMIRNFDAQIENNRSFDHHFTSQTGKDPPESGKGFPPSGDRPSQALVDAFENISIYSLYFHQTKRLPFLTRNLRKSFRRLCEELRILPNFRNPLSHGQSISLIYHYTPFVNGTTYDTYKTSLGTLECPLCSLFGPFSSYKALQKHFQWDHEEIQALLDQQVGERGNRFSQILIYLRGNTLLPEVTTSLHQESQEVVEVTTHLSQTLPSPGHNTQPNKTTSEIGNPDSVDSLVPQLARSHLGPLTKGIATHEFRTITPPPISDPHGPAHPIVGPDGDTSKNPISYRPTGPHLYDHLSSLPLELYGNRAWFVLDKEEEIFELTDVLDEDKVITALWGRWILLNRQCFIANYLEGVEAFVDQYWEFIHRVAGWGALRAWLLVLVSRRFLTNIQVVKVLKRYNELVGKENWYK